MSNFREATVVEFSSKKSNFYLQRGIVWKINDKCPAFPQKTVTVKTETGLLVIADESDLMIID